MGMDTLIQYHHVSYCLTLASTLFRCDVFREAFTDDPLPLHSHPSSPFWHIIPVLVFIMSFINLNLQYLTHVFT